jgi:NADPH:quinone reductase-like Zn-dependent oxidoreductase
VKALLSREAGGPETLAVEDMADPVAGPGEVLVAVKACGVNFPDTLLIHDLYQFKPQRPFAPGIELSGVVEAVGDGVTRCRPGDRVAAVLNWGAMAEKVAIAQDRIFLLPGGVSFEAGATLLLTFGTTIHALKDRGRLQAGETLLVLGAAGGVGLAAVEMGKAMGARVVAAVSSAEKAEAARQAGADETVIYARPPFDKDQARALSAQFKAACGEDGAHVIYDAVGGDYADPALRAIAWEGRYLVIGFAAGIPRLPLNLTLLKSCDVCGVFFGAFVERNPEHNARNIAELFAMVAAGKIAPRISQTFPLARGGEAIALLADRKAIGKVVVRVAD